MSTQVIDEKVVEMRFQNGQFEKGVKESMSTIDKLKASLNFAGASKSFNQITEAANKVSFKGLERNVDDLHNYINLKAMAMFTIVNNMVSQIQSSVTRMVKDFTIVPLSTGFQEYELKMGSVQTIMAATGESLETVNRYLEELNEYSDKTIYSFSDMTQNIGKFTNAGVKLEDAVLAMKGISNEAAVSGANANEASRAMYNLAQSLSMGYVQYIDWKSIENANMATVDFKNNLAETAIQLGVITKTTDGYYEVEGKTYNLQQLFKDALKDQWLTTDVLIGTLRDYADETTEIGKKAYAAAQDVKTFTMMMDTLKEAAQSGWAYTWEIFIGDFNEAKQMFTEFSNMFGKMIDESATARNSLLRGVLGSKWDQLIGYINEAGIATDEFEGRLTRTLRESGYPVDEMIEKWGSLSEAIRHMGDVKDKVIEVIKSFTAPMVGAGEAITDVSNRLDEFQNIVNKVIRGEFGNGKQRIDALTKAGYSYAQIQGLINKLWERNGHNWSDTAITMEDLVEVMGEMSNEELKQIGFTEEQIEKLGWLQEQAELTGSDLNELLGNLYKPSGRELIFDSIKNVVDAIVQRFQILKEAWRDVFPQKGTEELYGILEALHRFSESLILNDDKADKLKRTLRGIFSIFGIISDVIQTALQIFFPGLIKGADAVEDGVLGITANLGDAIYNFRQFMKEGNIVTDILMYLRDSFFAGIQIIGRFIDKIREIPFLQDIINAVIEALKKLGEFAKEIFGDFYDGMLDTDANMVEVFLGILDKIAKKLDAITDKIPLIKDLKNVFKKMFKDFKSNGGYVVKGFLKGLLSGIKNIPKIMIKFASTVVNTVKDYLGIASPSKVFFAIARWCIEGFIKGFTTYLITVRNATDKFNDVITNTIFNDNVSNKLSNMKDIFKKIFGSMSDFIAEFKNKLLEVMNELKTRFEGKDILDIAKKIMGIVLPLVITLHTFRFLNKFGDGIADFGEGMKRLGKAFQTVSKGIRDYFKSVKAKNYAKAISTLALTLTAMLGLILLMAHMTTSEDIDRAEQMIDPLMDMLINFGAIAAALLLFNGVASKLGGNAKQLSKVINSLTLLVLSVAASLWLIVLALDKLKDISPRSLSRSVGVLLDMLGYIGEIVAAIALLPVLGSGIISLLGGTTAKVSLIGLGMAFVGIATSLLVIATAIKLMDMVLNSLQSPSYTLKVLTGAALILGVCIAGIAIFGSLAGATGGVYVGIGVAFLSVAATLILMAGAMVAIDIAISAIKHPFKTLAAITGILLVFGTLAAVLAKLSIGMNPATILAIAATFIAFGIACKAMAKGLKLLNGVDMDPETATVVIFGMISMLLMLALSIAVLMGISDTRIAAATSTILAMSAMIAATTLAIAVLAKMIHDYDIWSILTAAGFVLLLLVTIGEMMKAISSVSTITGPGVASIVAIAFALGVLAYAMYQLQDVDPAQLFYIAAALDIVLGVLAGVAGIIQPGWSVVALFLAIAGSVWILADAIMRLGSARWEDLVQGGFAVLGLTLMLTALAAGIVLVGAALSEAASLALPFVAVMLGVAAAIWLISDAVVNLATHKDELAEFFKAPIEAIQGFIDKIKEAIQWLVDFDKKAIEWIPGMEDYHKRRDKDKIKDEITEALVNEGIFPSPTTRSMPESYDRPLSREKNVLPGSAIIQKRAPAELTKDAIEIGEEINDALTSAATEPIPEGDAMAWVEEYYATLTSTSGDGAANWINAYKEAVQSQEFDPKIFEFLDFENLGTDDVNAQSIIDTLSGGFQDGDYTKLLSSMGLQLDPNGNANFASLLNQDGINMSDILFGGFKAQNKKNIFDSAKEMDQAFAENKEDLSGNLWKLGNSVAGGKYIPVVNKSQFPSSSSFDGTTSLLSSLAAGSFGQSVQFPDTMNTTSPDVVNAISGLKQDITNLGQRISNLYVRLDTGVMVGTLTPYINENMGRITQNKGRWN